MKNLIINTTKPADQLSATMAQLKASFEELREGVLSHQLNLAMGTPDTTLNSLVHADAKRLIQLLKSIQDLV